MEVERKMIMKGLVIAEPLGQFDLEEGFAVVIKEDGEYHHVKLSHIDKDNNWVVEGSFNGKISDEQDFYKLICVGYYFRFPIAAKHYSRIIKKGMVDDDSYYSFQVVPYKFKKGAYNRTCTLCNSNFVASASQPLCENCCDDEALAHLVYEKSKSNKKEQIVLKDVIKLCFDSFNKGKLNNHHETFEKWLTKEIEKWQ